MNIPVHHLELSFTDYSLNSRRCTGIEENPLNLLSARFSPEHSAIYSKLKIEYHPNNQ
jgi:hypothetical protein